MRCALDQVGKLLAVALTAWASSAEAEILYNIRDLGLEFSGAEARRSYARAVAPNGVVVGHGAYAAPINAEQGIVWNTDGTWRRLESFIPNRAAYAYDISPSGLIVGRAIDTPGYRAAVWTGTSGVPTNITPDLTVASSEAWGVNASDVVVGHTAPDGVFRAFRWDADEGLSLLAMPAGAGAAYGRDINDLGVVAGYASLPIGQRAIVWDAAGIPKVLDPLIGPDAGRSLARRINNAGWVVGESSAAEGVRATLWREDTVLNLGTILGRNASAAFDINDAGQVVGYSANGLNDDNLNVSSRAFLWSESTGMQYLLDLVEPSQAAQWANLRNAFSIGNDGTITGFGQTADGKIHAFVMTLIPEPAALVLLLGAALCRARHAR